MSSGDDTTQKDLESWTYDDVKSADFLVLRNGTTNYVEDVLAPNGLQVGLLDDSFGASLFVAGPITGSSLFFLASSLKSMPYFLRLSPSGTALGSIQDWLGCPPCPGVLSHRTSDCFPCPITHNAGRVACNGRAKRTVPPSDGREE